MNDPHLTRNTPSDFVMVLITRQVFNLVTIPDGLALVTRERVETRNKLIHDLKKHEGIPHHDTKLRDTSHEPPNVAILHDEQIEILHMEAEVDGVLLQLEDYKEILVRFKDLDREKATETLGKDRRQSLDKQRDLTFGGIKQSTRINRVSLNGNGSSHGQRLLTFDRLQLVIHFYINFFEFFAIEVT